MRLSDYIERTHDLTPAEFARIIGVTPSAVHKYIHQGHIPGRSVMERIAKVTGGAVLPNDFYGLGGPGELQP